VTLLYYIKYNILLSINHYQRKNENAEDLPTIVHIREATVRALPVRGSVTRIEFVCETLILGKYIIKICRQVPGFNEISGTRITVFSETSIFKKSNCNSSGANFKKEKCDGGL
jgi:hypothetical protein